MNDSNGKDTMTVRDTSTAGGTLTDRARLHGGGTAVEDCMDVEQVGAPTATGIAGPATSTVSTPSTPAAPPAALPDAGPADFECIDAEQVTAETREKALEEGNRPLALLGYLLLGVYLGVVFVQSEVVSWFRIQEMFRFQSFHMYGIIGTAVAVAALSVQGIKRFHLKTIHGEPIEIAPKEWGGSRIPGARYWMGGTAFGMGWALVGACPGPMFALVGGGVGVLLVAILFAMAGTWTYAAVRTRLPH